VAEEKQHPFVDVTADQPWFFSAMKNSAHTVDQLRRMLTIAWR